MSRSFEQIMDDAAALLHRRGRITLGALRRQLDIEEDYALDVKEELIKGRRVAREEEGVLVWAGERTPERRQLTVMFCDLVGSAPLSDRLDPEEFRDLVRAYQAACEAPIRHFEGHVAQYLGDGILSYFGYPAAHEDDASRAVRAGLGILRAMRDLDAQVAREKGIRVAVRLAVHTGLVVVSEVGGAGRHGELAFGGAPNIAARIQSIARPGTLIASAATQRLVEGEFDFEDLGGHSLRGFDEPVHLYVVSERRDSASPRPHGRRARPLIGRARELEQLVESWESARAGRGRTVVVSGEAGIGKSHLVESVRQRADRLGARWIVFECSPYLVSSALHPVVAMLRDHLGLEEGTSSEAQLERLEKLANELGFQATETVPYLASLLGARAPVGKDYAGAATLAGKRAAHALLVELLLRMAADGPAVLVWEDLHWADPTTLDFLSVFFPRARERRLLSIGTTRPDGEAQWRDRREVTLLTLGRLAREDIEALVLEVTGGREVPTEILREIVTKTDGVPLFVEELTKSVLESDLLVEEGGRLALRASRAALGVPITLKDSLTSRLDRLADVKSVAQLAAAIGRTFSSDLLAAVGALEPTDVARAIARLVTAGLVLPPSTPDGTYAFKHALIRDAAYESLLLSSKHAIHERIAQAIEVRFPKLAESQPELLAQHLTQAGNEERAIGHWIAAGQRAAERSDNAEAAAHTSAGLALVERMPEGRERDQRELTLQIRHAGALRATKGFAAPDTGAAYTRARELCHGLKEDELLVPTLNGLYSFHLVRGEYAKAGVTAREILERAERERDVVHEMIGHRAVGAVLLHTGHLTEARRHLEKALAAYDADAHRSLAYTHGTDHAETTSCFLSLALWALGEERDAEALQARAIAHSEKIGHAHSLTQALAFDCLRRLVAGEPDGIPARAQRVLELSSAHWFPLFTAAARFWLAAAQRPRTEATLQEMHRATEAWWGTGAVGYRPCTEALMAEAHADVGDLGGALELIARAEAHQAESDERWTEPEVLRIKARLLAASSRDADAGRCLDEAMRVAQAQGAKVWEKRLRAAMSA